MGDSAAAGRLTARPGTVRETGVSGLHPLEPGASLYVPASYPADRPAPLVVSLHGAGGNAGHGLALLRDSADETGFLLLAPSALGRTWDVILEGYGPDVVRLDRALEQTFSQYAVDPEHLAVAGFSDGASYALSLGMMNGDLFSHVLAFSPGFAAPNSQQGKPRFFVSHGTRDTVLPVKRCSRKVVPQLERAGYAVDYQEFDGGHTVPEEVRRAAVAWFLA